MYKHTHVCIYVYICIYAIFSWIPKTQRPPGLKPDRTRSEFPPPPLFLPAAGSLNHLDLVGSPPCSGGWLGDGHPMACVRDCWSRSPPRVPQWRWSCPSGTPSARFLCRRFPFFRCPARHRWFPIMSRGNVFRPLTGFGPPLVWARHFAGDRGGHGDCAAAARRSTSAGI